MIGDLEGKTCLVTGGTSGIGRVVAEGLAARGARVVILARNQAKAELVRQAILRDTGNGDVEILTADLQSLTQVKGAAQRFLARHSDLHVLVHNAALWPAERELSEDGHELTFQVNYLSHFLLTQMLLPCLRRAIPSRVLSTTSLGHARGSLDFSDLRSEHVFTPAQAYANSKLAMVLFSGELARRMRGTGVASNSLCPGNVDTGLYEADPNFKDQRKRLAGSGRVRSAEAGAWLTIYLASNPRLDDTSGKFFSQAMGGLKPIDLRADPGACARLWDVSMELVGLR